MEWVFENAEQNKFKGAQQPSGLRRCFGQKEKQNDITTPAGNF